MSNDNIYRLRSSVTLVYSDNELNIFKTNVRENIFPKQIISIMQFIYNYLMDIQN